MPKLKVLGGKELIKIFSDFGFRKVEQSGSHVKMRRTVDSGRQTLTIPKHKEIDRGLLKQIFIQASQYISGDELRDKFYTK